MDKDYESFLFEGGLGRYDVLFKITVIEFSYIFVAKAVFSDHRHVPQHEVGIYTDLGRFQGRLIPVCLGLIDLERPIPLRNCQYVSHMMLMSYAGLDICSQTVSAVVDLDLETKKTHKELYAAGLSNNDIHNANLAWNEEAHRVMQFDFGETYMRFVGEPLTAPGPSPQYSPLGTKRHLNASQEGNIWGGDDLIKKRPRAAI